jgi:hypothetical protein
LGHMASAVISFLWYQHTRFFLTAG